MKLNAGIGLAVPAFNAGVSSFGAVLAISHWHADHVGGLAALAKMIPIDHFYDHGDAVDAVDRSRLEGYKVVAGAMRLSVR